MKKYFFLSICIITSVMACNSQNVENDKIKTSDIYRIAASEVVGNYLVASEKSLLDKRFLFQEKPEAKKEYEDLFNRNRFKNVCNWETEKASDDVRNIVELECLSFQLFTEMKKKYPVLKDKTIYNKMIAYAISNNEFYRIPNETSTQELLKRG
ncbi:MAG: hypothetical protein J5I59_08040 [Saprospiraceae bacterium]|nr:hypothetical protein [Saprospiraceae bacterium]